MQYRSYLDRRKIITLLCLNHVKIIFESCLIDVYIITSNNMFLFHSMFVCQQRVRLRQHVRVFDSMPGRALRATISSYSTTCS